jgi:hypothetical protein
MINLGLNGFDFFIYFKNALITHVTQNQASA